MRARRTFSRRRLGNATCASHFCVDDVPAVSAWYRQLLGCTSGHGGEEYERLMDGERLVLQLHRWDVEHEHGPLGDPTARPYGNGVVLWFELEAFDDAVNRGFTMNVDTLKDRRLSENSNWDTGCATRGDIR